jgi:hypothetical protein
MDFRLPVIDEHHGEFWLDHCGALMDVEPMGDEYVHTMCHTIEDPTFDATAMATSPYDDPGAPPAPGSVADPPRSTGRRACPRTGTRTATGPRRSTRPASRCPPEPEPARLKDAFAFSETPVSLG